MQGHIRLGELSCPEETVQPEWLTAPREPEGVGPATSQVRTPVCRPARSGRADWEPCGQECRRPPACPRRSAFLPRGACAPQDAYGPGRARQARQRRPVSGLRTCHRIPPRPRVKRLLQEQGRWMLIAWGLSFGSRKRFFLNPGTTWDLHAGEFLWRAPWDAGVRACRRLDGGARSDAAVAAGMKRGWPARRESNPRQPA